MPVVYIAQFIDVIVNLLIFMVFVRALLTWFPRPPHNALTRFIHDVTEPMYAAVRRLSHSQVVYFLTPLIIIFGLQILEKILFQILGSI